MGIIPGPAPGSSGSAMCQQRGNGASRACLLCKAASNFQNPWCQGGRIHHGHPSGCMGRPRLAQTYVLEMEKTSPRMLLGETLRAYMAQNPQF